MIAVIAPDDPKIFERPSIFLGGAITGAPDWQSEAVQMLESFATCFNPRRQDGFVPPDHPEYLKCYREQVRWEHKYLLAADVVLFWMPTGALSITTRFEIGWWFGMNLFLADEVKPLRPFAVGIEPGVRGETYYRVALPEMGIAIHSTLQATCRWAGKLAQKVESA
jgi:hypothetical protein